MSPSFAYGRGGRVYRYYVTTPASPEPGGGAPTIQRLSAPATEQFLADLMRRLSGEAEITRADPIDLLVRVEAGATETHLVIDGAAMFAGQPAELCLGSIQRRLLPGEAAAATRGKLGHVHVVLPQRLRLRGGSARIHGAHDDARSKVNPALVDALKRAHRALTGLRASPLSNAVDLHNAEAPATQYERQLSRLAFLSPHLQRRILSGRQPVGLAIRGILTSEMPLAWGDQSSWLEEIAGRLDAGRSRDDGEFADRRS